MKKAACSSCGESYEYEPLMLNGREMFASARTLCPKCQERREAEQAEETQRTLERERLAKVQQREREWLTICPPLYNNTRTDFHTVNKAALATISKWQPDAPGEDGFGLFIHGHTGRCKTRLAYWRLKQLFLAGWNVAAVTGKQFADAAVKQFSDDTKAKHEAIARLRECSAAKLLLFDDIGTVKFTERSVAELLGMVEERTSQLRPTLWTCNFTPDIIGNMLLRAGEENDRIVRRFFEFARVLHVE